MKPNLTTIGDAYYENQNQNHEAANEISILDPHSFFSAYPSETVRFFSLPWPTTRRNGTAPLVGRNLRTDAVPAAPFMAKPL